MTGGSKDTTVHQLVWRVEQALERAIDNATFESIEMAIEEARLDRSIPKSNSHMLSGREGGGGNLPIHVEPGHEQPAKFMKIAICI